MRRFLPLLVLIYIIFALTGDFSAIKRDFAPEAEATYIMSQRWEDATPASFDFLRRFYPKGGRAVLTWRGKARLYSPWIYNAVSFPFFRIFGERGLYLLNALLLGLSFWLLLGIFQGRILPFLAVLGSTLPVFLVLEGPYALTFTLAVLVFYFFKKENLLLASFFSGPLAFLSPPFFFFIPLMALKGKNRVVNLILGFTSFFLLVFAGLKLPGALPWDIPYLASLPLQASSFLTSPGIFYSAKFPALEFLFGRFTGAILYFPVLLLFLWTGWRQVLLGAIFLSAFLAINPVHAPYGFVGNPWLLAFLPFVMDLTDGLLKKTIVLLSILTVGLLNIFPLRSTSYPLVFTGNLPFHWGRVETYEINALPLLKVGENYHLDRNFFWYKGNSLRPRATDRVEFIRLTSSRRMLFAVKDLVGGNLVDFEVNGSRRKLVFKRKRRFMESFQGKEIFPGIYIYKVSLKAQRCRAVLPQKICLGAEIWWK